MIIILQETEGLAKITRERRKEIDVYIKQIHRERKKIDRQKDR